jgi:hypothetical protein
MDVHDHIAGRPAGAPARRHQLALGQGADGRPEDVELGEKRRPLIAHFSATALPGFELIGAGEVAGQRQIGPGRVRSIR